MQMITKESFIVSGMHRSGTTFVGKIVSLANGVTSLHEPFNNLYGIAGLDYVYPSNFDEDIKKKWRSVTSLNFKTVRKSPGDNYKKKFLRLTLGGKTNKDRLESKFKFYLNQADKLLIKDPFMLLLLESIAKNDNVLSVVTVRHPIAIWRSIKKQKWSFSFTNFANEKFVEQFGYGSRKQLNSYSEVEKFAFLYSILYGFVYNKYIENGCIKIILHEDLCVDPLGTFESIYNFLKLQMNESVISEINKFTGGNSGGSDIKGLHNFTRDSKKLAWEWAEKSESDDKIIEEICGEVVRNIYGSWNRKSN